MILNAITWDVDPEIFSIGSLEIRWYGLLFATAFLSGYIVFKKFLATDRLTSEMVDQLLIYTAIGGVLGARLGQGSEFSLLVSYSALAIGLIDLRASYLIQLIVIITFVLSTYWVVYRYRTPISSSEKNRMD